jgi:superfamily II DNA/RNA helicase/HKD family nuclease
MSLIDNKEKTMLQALKNALQSAESVDIEVGFFYFSGFELLAEELRDKHVRIIVGKYIDPECIPDIVLRDKNEGDNFDLDPFMPRRAIKSRSEKKEFYTKGFVNFVNDTSLFDSSDSQKALKIFISKIENGSLELVMASRVEHGKMYIIHNKQELSQGGDFPGTVFIGSSNFTYQGLQGQGELNAQDRNADKYNEYCRKFEQLWADSENINVATKISNQDFLKKLQKELWLYSNPSPFEVYIRVLHELFATDDNLTIRTPETITGGTYSDLEYQVDAIKLGLDRIEKYDGVIVADVVGLGKSIIASAIANNLDMKTIIITPPHLKDQWEEYQEEFKLRGARVFSIGKIDEIYDRYSETSEPILIVIDEAHRFRNEDTNDYKLLHQICRSHPKNKVLIITATPFNNDPKDVFALVKLFQTPGQATIKSVDNLSMRFRSLIDRYKKLRNFMRKSPKESAHINKESDQIALELRRLIESVIIRRSRIDIKTITRYREDLERQKIEFSEVIGPELLEYNLGEIAELYVRTIEKITGEDDGGKFTGARYEPAKFIKEGKRAEFIKQLGPDMDETDLKTAQSNLAKFMRRLLVTRFESSKAAFEITLSKMIESNILIEKWWTQLGKIPIQKKGQIPDPETIIQDTSDNLEQDINAETLDDELRKLNESKGLITIDIDLIKEDFIKQVRADKEILSKIKEEWFGINSKTKDFDPKTDFLVETINRNLAEDKNRKIVIFSAYADTVNYLAKSLRERGVKRVFSYTAADSSTTNKKIIKNNFDAGIKQSKQENDYDVLIATDALSEGYNLHRAGVIINYDIPYNPTRVIQRIGRINRINKRVFENIYIYNFFPTYIGEAETRIQQISRLKIDLINNCIGSDTRTLTKEEDLKSFFREEYKNEEEKQESLSWDAKPREIYDQAKKDADLMKKVMDIKARSRVVRTEQENPLIIAFGKKGSHAIFAMKNTESEPSIVSAEIAVPFFEANVDEKGQPADEQYDSTFTLVRDALFAKNPLPKIAGRRADALNILKVLGGKLPEAKDYCKDVDDIIRKYDDISEGALKDIAQLSLKNLNSAYDELKTIIPEHQIRVINERAHRLESEHEAIVLSEELRK